MAIFIALIFQVLFVFFAMAINIALVVHDKINLQNSADLAAYYGAQKQAEHLNVIAHINYQIRQSWKLLTWRYRVWGSMGLKYPPHPARIYSQGGGTTDGPYPQQPPLVCVAYKPTWKDVIDTDNQCKEANFVLPALPVIQVLAGFNSINAQIKARTTQLRMESAGLCDKYAAYNFWFSALILKAFREDQKNRKELMYALAQNLTKNDFMSLNGQPVKSGVALTLRKNLTHANGEGQPQIEFFNSLRGLERQDWLSEIRVSPTLLYADYAAGGDGEGCATVLTAIGDARMEHPRRPGARRILNSTLDPSGYLRSFSRDLSISADPNNPYAYSLGVEKNPWFWAYVGVKVRTTPRQLFFPLGLEVNMVARSFAKPFGGRIGPWFAQTWSQGALQSSGDNRIDPLLPLRDLASGFSDDPRSLTRLPNYSRFPGDQYGLKSRLALASLKNLSGEIGEVLKMKFGSFAEIANTFELGAFNDILPWDFESDTSPNGRLYELAAISPDLFDITYYSIAPNFNHNYLPKIQANRGALGVPGDLPIRGDLGTRGDQSLSVQDHIEDEVISGFRRPEAFYFVKEKAHLLTAWLPSKRDYKFDAFSRNRAVEDFGKCRFPDDELNLKAPGSCVAGGGRSGYSVKLISRDALLKGQFPIGGAGIEGDILNKPPEEEGW